MQCNLKNSIEFEIEFHFQNKNPRLNKVQAKSVFDPFQRRYEYSILGNVFFAKSNFCAFSKKDSKKVEKVWEKM